jgi:hypothetical protein
MNRSPRTATFPVATLKSAEPRLPIMPAKPGRFLKTTPVLFLAGRKTLDVPIVAPPAATLASADKVPAPYIAAMRGAHQRADNPGYGRYKGSPEKRSSTQPAQWTEFRLVTDESFSTLVKFL